MCNQNNVFINTPNFGYVETDLYRSAVPNEMNFPFLQTLNLKTVVYLSFDAPSVFFREFLKEHNIELVQISGDSETSPLYQKISENLIIDALHSILNPHAYPIIVMCNLGRHRTGTVIGCLRRIMKWSLSAILVEFRQFTNNKSSPPHEQFIELFDTELVEMPEDVELLPFKLVPDKNLFIKNEEQNHQNVSNTSGKPPKPIGTTPQSKKKITLPASKKTTGSSFF